LRTGLKTVFPLTAKRSAYPQMDYRKGLKMACPRLGFRSDSRLGLRSDCQRVTPMVFLQTEMPKAYPRLDSQMEYSLTDFLRGYQKGYQMASQTATRMATRMGWQMVNPMGLPTGFPRWVNHSDCQREMPKASPRLDYRTGNLKGMHLEYLQMGCQMGFHLGMQRVSLRSVNHLGFRSDLRTECPLMAMPKGLPMEFPLTGCQTDCHLVTRSECLPTDSLMDYQKAKPTAFPRWGWPKASH